MQMQETALNSLVDRVSVEQAANLASLACQTLDNQTQAQLVHHTSHNVRKFDFNLAQNTIQSTYTLTGFGGSVNNGRLRREKL